MHKIKASAVSSAIASVFGLSFFSNHVVPQMSISKSFVVILRWILTFPTDALFMELKEVAQRRHGPHLLRRTWVARGDGLKKGGDTSVCTLLGLCLNGGRAYASLNTCHWLRTWFFQVAISGVVCKVWK